jgi:predicted DCC family thiol-disulfide oxidoreductase YuxK
MDKLTLFFDGKCSVCVAEVDVYRKLDTDNKLNYVDISSPRFDASLVDIPEDRLNKYFNIQLEDGSFVEGVDSFIEIWKRVPKLKALAKIASFKPIHFVMHLSYLLFAEIRPYLPKKQCSTDGYCDMKFYKK